jgi:hypothetical protein
MDISPRLKGPYQEGILTILRYQWLFFEKWERVWFQLRDDKLVYKNANVSGIIDLWNVQNVRSADDSITMVEMQTKSGAVYVYFDSEVETTKWINIITDTILRSYALGYGDWQDPEAVRLASLDSRELRWYRRRDLLMALYLLKKKYIGTLGRIDTVNALISSPETSYVNMVCYKKELSHLKSQVPSVAFVSVFIGVDNDIIKYVASYL